uniref:Tr-type G domain-containing protein n=1 Tax=Plectus sambesii TaxID=2011161 RepID=A0A914W0Y2_9BILA
MQYKYNKRSQGPIVLKKNKGNKLIVEAYDGITVSELASKMEVDKDSIIEALLDIEKQNQLSSENRELEISLIAQVLAYFKMKLRKVDMPRSVKYGEDNSDDLDVYPQPPPDPKDCKRRSPVVTIMGHVDHGKTTLLDALRHSQIVESEFGGITQHIGAFSVKLPNADARITFLDTPGHAAFASMRQRGANATDIVVLVVAADDGVKEQTIESIRYAKNAQVPILVAVNKCDKPTANPEIAKRGLLEHDVVVEEYGGEVMAVNVSALKKTNLTALQEAIVTQAELMNLKGTWQGASEGLIIESKATLGKGKQSTLLVQRGTVRRGSVLVAGASYCKVRSLNDEHGRNVPEAGPSTPVEVTGWRGELPSAGEYVIQVENENRAQQVVAYRESKLKELKAEEELGAISEQRAAQRQEYQQLVRMKLAAGVRRKGRFTTEVRRVSEHTVNTDPKVTVLLKGDVDGSVEAIMEVIDTYKSDRCRLEVVDFGVGPPTEVDIANAAEFGAIIYCFNLPVPGAIKKLADEKKVTIIHFNIIYRLIEHLKGALTAQLPAVKAERRLGDGTVLKEFLISDRERKKQPVAGCAVEAGVFNRKARVRFSRGGTVYYDGEMESMKHEKEVVLTADAGVEIGIAIEDKSVRFEDGDTVECYELFDEVQAIDWSPRGF